MSCVVCFPPLVSLYGYFPCFESFCLFLSVLKWSDIWPSMVTHTWNSCSAFNPSKSAHTYQKCTHTHTHTHREHTPGAVGSHLCCGARGTVGGLVPCSRAPQSWYWRWRESTVHSLPTPTPNIRTPIILGTSANSYFAGHHGLNFSS